MPQIQVIQYQIHTDPVLPTDASKFESSFHQPWVEPKQTIAGKAIVGAFIAAISAGPFIPPVIQLEVITYPKWGYPWSEPVRLDLRHSLRTAAQQFLAFQLTQDQQPEQVTESRWHQPWSEPVRLPVGIKAQLQQFFGTDTTPFPTSKNIAWYAPFRDPARLKPGLKTPLQQFFAMDSDWIPHPDELLDGWFNWLTMPVMLPVALKSQLQHSLEWPPRILPTPTVTATMDALETNTDKMQAAVYIADAAGGRTRVSIIEVQVPLNNPSSIMES